MDKQATAIFNKVKELPKEEQHKALMQIELQLAAWNYANHDVPGTVKLSSIMAFEELRDEIQKLSTYPPLPK